MKSRHGTAASQAAPNSKLTRRTLLKAAAAGTVAAAGFATWNGRAPLFAQERKLHFLLNSNFRPLFDVKIRELAAEYSVSAERIRQIEAGALKKLKAAMA